MNSKRYYWLKLNVNFFQQREIKKLRRIAGGDTYTVIYLKMLLLAIQQEDCCIGYDVDESAFAEELSVDLDEDVENVRVTLQFLISNNLGEFIDGDMYLARVNEMVGSETFAAVRMRKSRYRHSEVQLECNNDVTMLHDCYENVAIEIDIDKEIEKEKDKSIDLSKKKSKNVVPKTKKTEKIPYGKYENIMLTEKQFEEFKLLFPENWGRFLDEATAYLFGQEENGHKKISKNGFVFLRNWGNNDFNGKRVKPVVSNQRTTVEEELKNLVF